MGIHSRARPTIASLLVLREIGLKNHIEVNYVKSVLKLACLKADMFCNQIRAEKGIRKNLLHTLNQPDLAFLFIRMFLCEFVAK